MNSCVLKNETFIFSSNYYSNILNNFFKSLKLFIRVVKLVLPANIIVKDNKNKDNTLFSVGSLIAPYGIDVNDFCANFNSLTKHFKKGLWLRVLLILLPDRKFKIDIKISSISFLVKVFLNKDKILNNSSIFLLDLYKIFCIYRLFYNSSKISLIRNICGVLNSFNNLKVILT